MYCGINPVLLLVFHSEKLCTLDFVILKMKAELFRKVLPEN